MRQVKLRLNTQLKDFSEFGFKTVIFTSTGEMHYDIYNMNDLEDFYRSLYYRV